ncbi:MAG: hypothetical protein L6R43_06840 [Planctomycetes bacterium]|nr:hypothetical protein [Planctomycetota bacterium]
MDADRRSPAAAFFLSVIPGVGHLYAGSVGAGLLWLLGTFLLYTRIPGLALVVHFVCAASAARAAAEANRREREEMHGRRENASDVARLIDDAARRGGGSPAPAAPAAPGPVGDPAPRLMRAAFPVPAAALVEGLAKGMQAAGLLVLGVDRGRLRVRGSADLGGGLYTTAVAQVEATPAGSRVRLMVDRPEGSPLDPARDDAILREILERTERAIAAGAAREVDPSAPRAMVVVGGGEELTEDHFLEQLREAWESREQGWLPEGEWEERKRSLVAGVRLRPGTRFEDFMAICRPLADAAILDEGDLRALQSRLR